MDCPEARHGVFDAHRTDAHTAIGSVVCGLLRAAMTRASEEHKETREHR